MTSGGTNSNTMRNPSFGYYFTGLWSCSLKSVPRKGSTLDHGDLLTGNLESRQDLLTTAANRGQNKGNLTHSFYKPLRHLINDLATIIVIDGHWLLSSDPRTDLFYIIEAFQRLILNFVIDNRGEEFMDRPVEKAFREVQGTRRSNACSTTSCQSWDVMM